MFTLVIRGVNILWWKHLMAFTPSTRYCPVRHSHRSPFPNFPLDDIPNSLNKWPGSSWGPNICFSNIFLLWLSTPFFYRYFSYCQTFWRTKKKKSQIGPVVFSLISINWHFWPCGKMFALIHTGKKFQFYFSNVNIFIFLTMSQNSLKNSFGKVVFQILAKIEMMRYKNQ